MRRRIAVPASTSSPVTRRGDESRAKIETKPELRRRCGRHCRQAGKKNLLGPYHIPLPDEPINTEHIAEQWDGTGHLLLAKDFTTPSSAPPPLPRFPCRRTGPISCPGSVINFREVAVPSTPLFTFSELREGDRYSKVDAPLGCDWRILVISHPLARNIKVEWR